MAIKGRLAAAAALGLFLAGSASADEFLGSYVARLSVQDHHASDGYPLGNAAQVVRQDRANVHKFGRIDADDDDDPWFETAASRTRMQKLLEAPGAIDPATRRAIMNGTPLVQVDVYRSGIRAHAIGD
jgi:hypothetical protein